MRSPIPLSWTDTHRLGRVTDAGSKPNPRAFIVCFHHFQDKEQVLARQREELTFCGHRINICATSVQVWLSSALHSTA